MRSARPVRVRLGVRPSGPISPSVLDLLEDAGDTDLDELVEIASGDREEFHALEKRDWKGRGFLEDAIVELHPAVMAIEEHFGTRSGRVFP